MDESEEIEGRNQSTGGALGGQPIGGVPPVGQEPEAQPIAGVPSPIEPVEAVPIEEEAEQPLFTVGLAYEEWEASGFRRSTGDAGSRVGCLILLIVLVISGVVLGMKWAAEEYEVPSFLFWLSDEYVGDLIAVLTIASLLVAHVTTRHLRASRGGAAVFPDRVEVAHPSTLGLLLGGGSITACPWEAISGYRDTSEAYVQLYRKGAWRLPLLSHAIPTPAESGRVTLLLHLDGHRLPRFG